MKESGGVLKKHQPRIHTDQHRYFNCIICIDGVNPWPICFYTGCATRVSFDNAASTLPLLPKITL